MHWVPAERIILARGCRCTGRSGVCITRPKSDWLYSMRTRAHYQVAAPPEASPSSDGGNRVRLLAQSLAKRHPRRVALVRLLLGQSQIAGATATLLILASNGFRAVTPPLVWVACITAGITLVSVFLFRYLLRDSPGRTHPYALSSQRRRMPQPR